MLPAVFDDHESDNPLHVIITYFDRMADFISELHENKDTNVDDHQSTWINAKVATGRDTPSDQPPLELRFPPPRPRRSGHVSIAPIQILVPFLAHLLYKIVQEDVWVETIPAFDGEGLPRVWVDNWFSAHAPTPLEIRNPGGINHEGIHIFPTQFCVHT